VAQALDSLSGPGALAWGIIGRAVFLPVFTSMLLMMLLLLLRVILRKQWLAVSVLFLLLAGGQVLAFDHLWVDLGLGIIMTGVLIFVMLRFGLLALMAVQMTLALTAGLGINFEFGEWSARASLVGIILIAALTGYAFYIALAGRPLFKDAILEE
jgi:hypothetical protein